MANSKTEPSSTVMVATTSRLAVFALMLKLSEASMPSMARDCTRRLQ